MMSSVGTSTASASSSLPHLTVSSSSIDEGAPAVLSVPTTGASSRTLARNLSDIEQQFTSSINAARAELMQKDQAHRRITALEAKVQALQDEADLWKTRWQNAERLRLEGAGQNCIPRPPQANTNSKGRQLVLQFGSKSSVRGLSSPSATDSSLPHLTASSSVSANDVGAPLAPPSLYITEASVLSERVEQLKEMLSRALREKSELSEECRKYRLLANCRTGKSTQMQQQVEGIQNKLRQSQLARTALEAEVEELKLKVRILEESRSDL